MRSALERQARVKLAALPTPLEPMHRLTAKLGGAALWIKRDDLSGLAVGGNKTGMLEYVLGKALAEGKDTVVGGAAVQSNYCRQLAAAAAKTGMECHLILRKVRGARDEEIQGGLLIDLLVGARVQLVEDEGSWGELGARIRQRAKELELQGRKVLVGRVGDESSLGLHAVGYVHAALELLEQAEAAALRIDDLWMSSSDATQAGLALALKHVGSPIKVVGAPALPTPVTPGRTFPECFAEIGNVCAQILGLETRLEPDDFVSHTEFVGPGYAKLTTEAREALLLFGSYEAILLDPVYTAKAAAGLIHHIRTAAIPRDRTVVFLHTGGGPALFAYADTLGLSV